MRYVYVLDMNGNPMMPTTRFGNVRRMLKAGQAKVVSSTPFTIQLTYEPKTHVVQPVTVGIDPGRTNIGLAAVRSDGTDLYRAHCETSTIHSMTQVAGILVLLVTRVLLERGAS